MTASSAQDGQAIRERLHAVAERIRQRAAQGRQDLRPRRPALAPQVPPVPPSEPLARVHHWSDVGEEGPEEGGGAA